MEKRDLPTSTTAQERAAMRKMLRKGAIKHKFEKEIVSRMAGAAEIVDPQTDAPKLWFRQGQLPNGTPGHVHYWIQSSANYTAHPADIDHAEPPFYDVRLGANGDDHGCTCGDMSWGKSPSNSGAPVISGKHYCKHVMAAIALEWLRDNPLSHTAEEPDREELEGRGWLAQFEPRCLDADGLPDLTKVNYHMHSKREIVQSLVDAMHDNGSWYNCERRRIRAEKSKPIDMESRKAREYFAKHPQEFINAITASA